MAQGNIETTSSSPQKHNQLVRSLPVLILVALFSIPAGLNYSGFCFAKSRWLSDEELMRPQVASVNRRAVLQDSEHFPNVARIPYQSVEELITKNPNCCKILDRSAAANYFGLTAFDSLMGANRGVVLVQFEDNYLDNQGQAKSTPAKWLVPITNCGKQNFD